MQLRTIPLIDIRHGGPLALATQRRKEAAELIGTGMTVFGAVSRILSRPALPIGDALSRRWLEKTGNPYRHEIYDYEYTLGVPGVLSLNLSYEWACTSGVYRKSATTTLARVLDWPFPGLGENVVVAHQRGVAGEFYNVTWPAISGIFQAMAPGRFSASLNQAPMRRYRTGLAVDWLRNRLLLERQRGLPPSHLLRKVFETATSYEQAKAMLAREPVCLPVTYILAGTRAGEGCVIERLETIASIRELSTNENICAANHFESPLKNAAHGWRSRGCDSHGRSANAHTLFSGKSEHNFAWFQPPVANSLSRLAMLANAADGTLSLIGTNGITPVSEPFHL